jgi:ankyrin repeat protein
MRIGPAALVLGLTLSVGVSGQAPQPPVGDGPLAPLTEAVWTGDLTRVRQLLDAGDDPAAEDAQHSAPWMWAILARDRRATEWMLEKTRSVRADGGIRHLALHIAANLNDLPLVRVLVDKGALVDGTARDGTTAVAVAAASGYADVLRYLIARGANTKLPDEQGDTALAAATRAGSLDCIKLLLAAGVDVNHKDNAGRTALMWAARSGRLDPLRSLIAAGADLNGADNTRQTALTLAVAKRNDAAERELRAHGTLSGDIHASALPSIRDAAVRGLALVQRGVATWNERRECSACHHHPLMLRTTGVAQQRGFPIDSALLNAVLRDLSTEDAGFEDRVSKAVETHGGVLRASLRNNGDAAFGNAWFLSNYAANANARGRRLDATTRLIAANQLPNGSWRYGPPRVPVESSDFTTTASAVRVLQTFGPASDRQVLADRIARASAWLQSSDPPTIDDKAFRLLGLKWSKADASVIATAADALRREQNVDGGWSQLRGLNSDAYATGLVLVALHEGGDVRVTNAAYQHGIQYLLRTQEADGSWLVHKRAVPMNAYFESGFPHGKFQFISYAGTCWATMALMYAANLSAARQ